MQSRAGKSMLQAKFLYGVTVGGKMGDYSLYSIDHR